MRRFIFILLFCCITNLLTAQIQAIGSFRDHLPYKTSVSVAASQSSIYSAAGNSILVYDKSTAATSTLSKVNGLSDVDIVKVYYIKRYQTLAIAYKNGNIDLIQEGTLTNIPDIKNKQITGSKLINNIFDSGKILYLCFPFGVITIDMERFLIMETCYTTVNGETLEAHDLILVDSLYYLATDKGIYTFPTDRNDFSDFSKWKLLPFSSGQIITYLHTDTKRIYACNSGNGTSSDSYYTAFRSNPSQWSAATDLGIFSTQSINNKKDTLVICDWDHIAIYVDGVFQFNVYGWSNPDADVYVKDAIIDEDNLWIADMRNGLGCLSLLYYNSFMVTPDGPCDAHVEGLSYNNKITCVAPGMRRGNSWSPNYIAPSFSYFIDNEWHYVKKAFDAYPATRDITCVVMNPRNNKEFYLASWGDGLFRCYNDSITNHYTSDNSLLSTYYDLIYVSGLCYDNNNNLWFTNSKTSELLKVIKADGTWKSFALNPYATGASGDVAEYVLIDQNNRKWITFPKSNHIVVFDDNNTIDKTSDDRLTDVNMNTNTEVTSGTILSIAEDKEGQIWIGTDKGLKVIYSPSSVFNGGVYPQNILVEDGGYTVVLLEFESVSAIAVDGANRKWIGTTKAGAFLLSANGTEELLHLTAENSPLLSNQINAISIDDETGEVFFGTANGIISYRGTATKGKDNYDEALVFPNPVHSGYLGNIAVSGLMENSFCKIVDAAGQLVWQGYANGGELIWNGKDFYGRRPATGVYYVFASNADGKEKKVAKILFIN